ncbi:MAG: tetratricopeptide repeat protein [Peptococcaceae bacterium]|nr:tetratricopeptide repeat protein [Peptococcaceae bacterium]
MDQSSYLWWQGCLEKGLKFLAAGDFVQAEEYFRLSFAEAEKLGVEVILAFSIRLLATAQLCNHKLDEAEAGFKKALSLCMQLNNNKGIAEAKAGLAGVALARGQYSEAESLYKQAIYFYPKNASSMRLAVLYSDLGQVYARLRQWTKAEKALLQADALCRQNCYSQGEAEVNNTLGEVYYFQGKNKTALQKFKRAGILFNQNKDEVSLANTQQYLAFLYLENNKIEEALFYQYRAICLYLKLNLKQEISESYYFLSNILQYYRLYDEAQASLNISLKYYQGLEFGLAIRYHGLAVIALMKKEYEQAKDYYLQALKFFQFYGCGPKIGEISEELTFLLKYENVLNKSNFYKLIGGRYDEDSLPQYEVMLYLANSLVIKGKYLAALHCSWRALAIAKAMNYETEETELMIQNISERIRNIKKQ